MTTSSLSNIDAVATVPALASSNSDSKASLKMAKDTITMQGFLIGSLQQQVTSLEGRVKKMEESTFGYRLSIIAKFFKPSFAFTFNVGDTSGHSSKFVETVEGARLSLVKGVEERSKKISRWLNEEAPKDSNPGLYLGRGVWGDGFYLPTSKPSVKSESSRGVDVQPVGAASSLARNVEPVMPVSSETPSSRPVSGTDNDVRAEISGGNARKSSRSSRLRKMKSSLSHKNSFHGRLQELEIENRRLRAAISGLTDDLSTLLSVAQRVGIVGS